MLCILEMASNTVDSSTATSTFGLDSQPVMFGTSVHEPSTMALLICSDIEVSVLGLPAKNAP